MRGKSGDWAQSVTSVLRIGNLIAGARARSMTFDRHATVFVLCRVLVAVLARGRFSGGCFLRFIEAHS